MSATVTLFDPATGVRIDCDDLYLTPSENPDSIWIWTDGNYACDCNKRVFMARAGALGYSDDEDTDCGDTIVLEKIVADDGRVLYQGTR